MAGTSDKIIECDRGLEVCSPNNLSNPGSEDVWANMDSRLPSFTVLARKGYMYHLLNPERILYLKILQTLLCRARHTLEHTEEKCGSQ